MHIVEERDVIIIILCVKLTFPFMQNRKYKLLKPNEYFQQVQYIDMLENLDEMSETDSQHDHLQVLITLFYVLESLIFWNGYIFSFVGTDFS